MARYTGPVLKRCRALGLEPQVLGLIKSSKKQAKTGNKKISEYGLQLREKQRAKFIYGVLEKPFRNYFKKASKMKGQTGANLLQLLERRIDNVVFRAGLARTRVEARQIVRHRHILVNGKRVDIPSYTVSLGDVIEVAEKYRGMERYKLVLDRTSGRIVPEWLNSDQEALKVVVEQLPTREMIDIPVEEMLIVELYSK